ncbi:MAG: hypothetical protein ACR2FM_03405 [Candidatus Saccharimonadales bacterium]
MKDHLRVAAANIRKAANEQRTEAANLRRAADEKRRDADRVMVKMGTNVRSAEQDMKRSDDDNERRQKQTEVQHTERRISLIRVESDKEHEQLLREAKSKEAEVGGLKNRASDLESKAGGPSFL